MKYNLYVDFDTVLYRQIKGLQRDYIEVKHEPSGRTKDFKNITEFKGRKKTEVGGWLGDLNKSRDSPFLLKEFEIIPKSEIIVGDSIAQKNVRNYIKELQELPWAKDIKLLIGGDNNFRYSVAKSYKSNRGPKPLRFLNIRKWFIDEFKDITTVCDGAEADDFLSIAGWYYWNKDKENSDFVACHIDKDCNTFPGKHWNYDKRGDIYEVDEFTAHYNLAIQCIVGDGIDGIDSVPKANDCMTLRYPIGKGGIGPVKAKRILKGCKTIKELYKEVEEVYKCYYDKDYKEPLNLTYKLVHLLIEKDRIDDFPFSG